MSHTSGPIQKKICLIGQFAVGKTSLVERFVYNRFGDQYLTTVGVKVSLKLLPPITEGVTVKQYQLVIWDIAGIDAMDAMTTTYFRGAAGALVVADLTRTATITALPELISSFRQVNPEAALVILGNKQDLTFSPETHQQLQSIARQWQAPVVLTSAKTGFQVEKAFMKLAELL